MEVPEPPMPKTPPSPADIPLTAVFAGFVALWLLLDRTAAWLGSLRGEYGAAVCGIVLGAALAIECALGRSRPATALRRLGLRASPARALACAAGLAALLVAFFPLYAAASGAQIALRADWWLLLPGLFAQAGIAEETLFRGFLFRHVRARYSFWKASAISAGPFVAVHLTLFASLDAALALTSLLVAVSLSFPLAWLFDRGGGSIWPPAILHCAVQGAIKLVDAEASVFLPMALWWMAVSADPIACECPRLFQPRI